MHEPPKTPSIIVKERSWQSVLPHNSGEEAVQEAAGETSVCRRECFAGFLSQETSEQGARTCGL
jgi:hypothetical protein